MKQGAIGDKKPGQELNSFENDCNKKTHYLKLNLRLRTSIQILSKKYAHEHVADITELG